MVPRPDHELDVTQYVTRWRLNPEASQKLRAAYAARGNTDMMPDPDAFTFADPETAEHIFGIDRAHLEPVSVPESER